MMSKLPHHVVPDTLLGDLDHHVGLVPGLLREVPKDVDQAQAKRDVGRASASDYKYQSAPDTHGREVGHIHIHIGCGVVYMPYRA